MTENDKPEWFEIAESDGPAAPPKASKKLPLAAVFATVLILGIGAVVGQVQEKSPVNPDEAASVQTIVSDNITASAPVVRIANPATSSAITGNSELQNPAIAQLPTKGDDDDDDDEDEDEEEEDDDEGDDD
jgi:Na+-transporting methylmalonyl-CoA/oxaloacetate decarboxylase gamma subunit